MQLTWACARESLTVAQEISIEMKANVGLKTFGKTLQNLDKNKICPVFYFSSHQQRKRPNEIILTLNNLITKRQSQCRMSLQQDKLRGWHLNSRWIWFHVLLFCFLLWPRRCHCTRQPLVYSCSPHSLDLSCMWPPEVSDAVYCNPLMWQNQL